MGIFCVCKAPREAYRRDRDNKIKFLPFRGSYTGRRQRHTRVTTSRLYQGLQKRSKPSTQGDKEKDYSSKWSFSEGSLEEEGHSRRGNQPGSIRPRGTDQVSGLEELCGKVSQKGKLRPEPGELQIPN